MPPPEIRCIAGATFGETTGGLRPAEDSLPPPLTVGDLSPNLYNSCVLFGRLSNGSLLRDFISSTAAFTHIA